MVKSKQNLHKSLNTHGQCHRPNLLHIPFPHQTLRKQAPSKSHTENSCRHLEITSDKCTQCQIVKYLLHAYRSNAGCVQCFVRHTFKAGYFCIQSCAAGGESTEEYTQLNAFLFCVSDFGGQWGQWRWGDNGSRWWQPAESIQWIPVPTRESFLIQWDSSKREIKERRENWDSLKVIFFSFLSNVRDSVLFLDSEFALTRILSQTPKLWANLFSFNSKLKSVCLTDNTDIPHYSTRAVPST